MVCEFFQNIWLDDGVPTTGAKYFFRVFAAEEIAVSDQWHYCHTLHRRKDGTTRKINLGALAQAIRHGMGGDLEPKRRHINLMQQLGGVRPW